MAKYELKCAVCGESFTATSSKTKYCSPLCRATGAKNARKEWESRSNYKETQRLKMKERRREEKLAICKQKEEARAAREIAWQEKRAGGRREKAFLKK